MTKIKNFLSKVGNWFKKAWRVSVNFFTNNVWAGVLAIVVLILLFILIVQGIVKGIDKCSNSTTESSIANRATNITSSQLMDKLNNGDTFVLFIGAASCSHCKQFYKTINAYVNSGKTVYYLDIDDTSDPTMQRYIVEIEERLLNDIPSDRGITTFATPTTVYVENGEFADAIQGAYGMQGGTNYAIFCDVVEGKYVGKATYVMKAE